jgi:hypothetical protein
MIWVKFLSCTKRKEKRRKKRDLSKVVSIFPEKLKLVRILRSRNLSVWIWVPVSRFIVGKISLERA